MAVMEPNLPIKDIADLFVTATGRIEWYWNFYVVMVIALVGWLVSKDNPLTHQLKVTITIGYVVFVLMNLYGLWGSYTFTEALRMDLLAAANDQNQLQHARAVLTQHSFGHGPWVAVLTRSLHKF